MGDSMDSTARGLLMPSPRPRLLLIPTMATTAMATVWDTDMDVDTMVAMDSMDSTARGLLMPSPRPIPTILDTDTVLDTVTDMVLDTAMATVSSTDKSSLPHRQGKPVTHQILSVNHQLP